MRLPIFRCRHVKQGLDLGGGFRRPDFGEQTSVFVDELRHLCQAYGGEIGRSHPHELPPLGRHGQQVELGLHHGKLALEQQGIVLGEVRFEESRAAHQHGFDLQEVVGMFQQGLERQDVGQGFKSLVVDFQAEIAHQEFVKRVFPVELVGFQYLGDGSRLAFQAFHSHAVEPRKAGEDGHFFDAFLARESSFLRR